MLQSFAGGSLVAERFGSGAPRVLALHGWAHDRSDFVPLLGVLGVDAVALDLPGFGLSPPPTEALDVAGYARAVLPVLETMAPEVFVVGHSFGGRVALHLAALVGGRVGGLVITGAPVRLGPLAPTARPPLGYRAVRALARAGLVADGRLEAARQRYGSADYRAAQGVMREVLVRALNERDDEVVAALDCPVELVWGRLDSAAPVTVAELTAASLRRGRLTVLDGVDHYVPVRAPEALAAALHRLGAIADRTP